MKVLVDTSVWPLALRRGKNKLSDNESKIVNELKELIKESRVILIGPIRQELLSGISSLKQFEDLKNKLKAFEDHSINVEDYEKAAEFFNICRKNGIQGSQVDFIICSIAYNNNFLIFSIDKDFNYYSKHIDITKHKIRF